MKMLIGDTPNQDYEDFLLQTMELLTTENVKSMAVVVFTEGERRLPWQPAQVDLFSEDWVVLD